MCGSIALLDSPDFPFVIEEEKIRPLVHSCMILRFDTVTSVYI